MIRRQRQHFVERTTRYSVEDIMLNLILMSIKGYKASFQPDNNKSPQRAKIRLIHLIKRFSEIAEEYGNGDLAFSAREIISGINSYKFDDAEYSALQLRNSLSSTEIVQRQSV